MKRALTYLWRYFFWGLSRIFVKYYLCPKFHVTVRGGRIELSGRPFVMIANHGMFFDPWLVGHYSRHPVSIMMNDEGFRAGLFTKWYLTQIGAFPKKKGASDYSAVKTMMARMKQGYSVLIFPEGQASWDGETQPIFSGIEKIIKKMGTSLYIFHLKGNFLSKPWWSDYPRKGRIEISVRAFDKSAVQSLSEQELRNLIVSNLYQNEIKDRENQTVPFTGDNCAPGLEWLVWICRHCEREDTLVTAGNTVSCTACGSSWHIDALCRLSPSQKNISEIGDLHDWMSWHKEWVLKKLTATSGETLLTKSDYVRYGRMSPKGIWETLAEGSLEMTKNKLLFTCAGNHTPLVLPVQEVTEYVFQLKNILAIRFNGEEHRFLFSGHSPIKWIFYLRYLHGYEEYEKRGYI
jgi:1-acyl-sn-glycerol-3-phosphate acyltransferase